MEPQHNSIPRKQANSVCSFPLLPLLLPLPAVGGMRLLLGGSNFGLGQPLPHLLLHLHLPHLPHLLLLLIHVLLLHLPLLPPPCHRLLHPRHNPVPCLHLLLLMLPHLLLRLFKVPPCPLCPLLVPLHTRQLLLASLNLSLALVLATLWAGNEPESFRSSPSPFLISLSLGDSSSPSSSPTSSTSSSCFATTGADF